MGSSSRTVPVATLLLVLASLGPGCGGGGAGDTTADAAADAPDGVGCEATTPRTVIPEAFVGPTGLQDRLGTLIDSAQTTLDVQMYLFTVRALADKIVAAKQRGVTVRMILDPDEAGNQYVIPTLDAGGINWKNASTIFPYSHAKYLIIDQHVGVIMSMNFNVDAMNNERNYGMVDSDPEDVADLQKVFEQDWQLANGMSATPPDLSCTRLIITPVNAQQRLLAFINSATTTLDVEALYVTEASTRNAIGAAAQRGVSVRVILESPQDQSQNADTTTYFTNVGVPVKYVTNQFYLHAKLLIADGVAFVGSQNFSTSGLTKNREMGALVMDPTQAAVIQQQFDADWGVTVPAN